MNHDSSLPSKFSTLDWWRLSTVAMVRSDIPDLSLRQLGLLLTVYMTPAPHTVKGLANILGIAKPAISRALDRLEMLEFLKRRTDDRDRRNVLISRTVKGSVFLSDLSEMIHAASADSVFIPHAARPDSNIRTHSSAA